MSSMFFTSLVRHTSDQISFSSQSSESTTMVWKACFSVYRSDTAFITSSNVAATGYFEQSMSARPSSVCRKIGFGAAAAKVLLPMPGVP